MADFRRILDDCDLDVQYPVRTKKHEEREGGIYEISGEFHGSRINRGERGEREVEANDTEIRFIFARFFELSLAVFREFGAMKHETRHRDDALVSPAAR